MKAYSLNKKKVVMCGYTMERSGRRSPNWKGFDIGLESLNTTRGTFKRRSYHLIDNPRFILIHYFDELYPNPRTYRRGLLAYPLGEKLNHRN